MSDKEEDFEAVYDESLCQCGDEGLDWEWEHDEIQFEATCSCFKKHCLKPINCKMKIVSDDLSNEDY